MMSLKQAAPPSSTQRLAATTRLGPGSAARSSVRPRAYDDEAPPTLTTDWRAFRAKLVQEQTVAPVGSTGRRWCKANMERLVVDNPRLAAEGPLWCHASPGPERGGLLVATPDAPLILGSERYTQLVVLLVEHGEHGAIGLILNRPTGMHLGKGPSGMPFQLSNTPADVQQVFGSNRLYCGGFVAQHVIHLIGGQRLPGAQQVVEGIYTGGELAAAREVIAGKAGVEDFRFFAGALVWEPGELTRDVNRGCWYTAACSRALVLKQCLQLPTPLWREVLMLMGGEYSKVAQAEARSEGDWSDDEEEPDYGPGWAVDGSC